MYPSYRQEGDNMTIISQIKQKNNILDYLEETEEKYRYNTAVSDGEESLTWHELIVMAKKAGCGISRIIQPGSPVPVMMEKSPITLAVMLAAVYAGCFYVPVNPDNPPERLEKIFQTLESEIIIADRKSREFLMSQNSSCKIILAEELLQEDVNAGRLAAIREKVT